MTLRSKIIAEIRGLQRQRSVVLKFRNMISNNLQAVVASDILDYSSELDESDRKKKFAEAAALVKDIEEGRKDSPYKTIVRSACAAIQAFDEEKKRLEKQMLSWVKQLPIITWAKKPEQRGFGPLFLAIVIGETGDLANYPKPGKLWKRMGCAPHTFDGKTAMGATWKVGKEGKLPTDQWETFGYSPRRRSIAYLIGEGIVKQNMLKPGANGVGESHHETESAVASPGPYRSRYDTAKALAKEKHPDWSPLRCHRHAMLLATKLLLKNLWIEWNK